MDPQWSLAQYTMPPSSIAVSYATSAVPDIYTVNANVSLPVVLLEPEECPEDFVPPLPPLTSIPPPPIESPPPLPTEAPPLDPPLPTEAPPTNPPLPSEPPPIDPSPPAEPPPTDPLSMVVSNYQYDVPPPGIYAPELPLSSLYSTEVYTTEVHTTEVHTIEVQTTEVKPPSLYTAFVCPNKLSDATNFVQQYSVSKSTAYSSVYTTTPSSGYQPAFYCDPTQRIDYSAAQSSFSQSIPYAIPQSVPNSALPNSGIEQCYEITDTSANTTWNQNTSANYFPGTMPGWEQSNNFYRQESENVQPFSGNSFNNYGVQYRTGQMHQGEMQNSSGQSGFKYFSNKIGDRRSYTNSSGYNSYRSSVSSAIWTCTKRKRESFSEEYLGDRKRFKVEGKESPQGQWGSSRQTYSKYHNLSTKIYKYICSSPAENYYSSKNIKDSKEVVATNPLIALYYRFNYELVDRAMRVRALKPISKPPRKKRKLQKSKFPKDSDEDSSDYDINNEEDTTLDELQKKRRHPDRLHYELWFNDAKEMNDGLLCRCSVKAKRTGIRHNIYAGEDHLPYCNPFSNNVDRLYHYKITMTPLTNFQADNPTTILHESHRYHFEGFSMFSHSPLPKLPDCKVIRFNYEYAIKYVEEDIPKNFTVQGLELFRQYLLTEILELVDVNWKAHDDPDGCPRFHFMPRFSRELEDGGKELLAHCHVLEYLLNKNKILIPANQLHMILRQRARVWDRLIDEVKGMIVTCPGKKPSSIRVDQLDRVNRNYRDKFPVIVHFGMRPHQLSYAGNPYYQKAWRDYVRFRHLLANQSKVTCHDRHRLMQKETRLQEMRMESDLKREVTVEVSSKNFYKTGIMSDVVQHAMLLPVLVSHLRFHLSLDHLEAKLEYKFKDRFLLQLALTHPSYRENFGTNPDHARNSLSNCGLRQPQYGDRRIHFANTRKKGINTLIKIMSRFGREKEASSFINHNERLEFLGDAVIEFVSTVHLYYMFPDIQEGGLSSYRASIVQNQHLSNLSNRLELDRYMLYAHGSDLCHDLELRHAMANCFEALMGALYLDGGIEIADKVFTKALFDEPDLMEAWKNFSLHPLQEQEPDGDRRFIAVLPILQKVAKFEETIGIEFNHIRILARALTHRSLGYNNLTMGSNQRLEFLGDAVLQLLASEYLYKFFPEHHEGHLSLLRSSLVNNRTIAVVCSDLGMAEYAIYNENKVELKSKDKADFLEAFLGALYVDKDLGYCRKFCEVCFFPRLQDFILNQDWNDPKSKLQQCCLTLRSADGGEPDIPTYKVVECIGPTNTRLFSVAVYFQGNRLAVGSGQSIQQAQMNAAAQALENGKDLFPQLRHQRQAIERIFRKDASTNDHLNENEPPEDPLTESTIHQLKENEPTNDLLKNMLTINQIKKEPSEDYLIEKESAKNPLILKTPSKNQLDKKQATKEQLPEKESTKIQMEKKSANDQLKEKGLAVNQLKKEKSTRDQLKINELSKYQLKDKSSNSWLRQSELIKEEELEEESSSEEEGEIKEEKSTNKRRKPKVSTVIQLNEKVSTNVQLQEKASTNVQLQEKASTNVQLNEKVSTKVQLKEKVLSKDQLKERVLSKDHLQGKVSTKDQRKEKESTKSQLPEKESTKRKLPGKESTIKQLEKKPTNNQLKEKVSTNDQLKKESLFKDQLKKEKSTKDQLKGKESSQLKEKILFSSWLKESELPKGQLKKTLSATNQLLEEESSEEEGEIKEKKSTKNQVKSKVSTMVQLKKKASTTIQIQEKVTTKVLLKEKVSTNVQLKEKLLTSIQQKENISNIQLKEKTSSNVQPKEKVSTNVHLKEKVATKNQIKEKVTTNNQLKEKVVPKDQLKEKVAPKDQLKEKVAANVQPKEKVSTNIQPKEKVLLNVHLKEKVGTKDQLKEKIALKDQLKEKIAPKDQLKEKVAPNILLKEKIVPNIPLKEKVLTSGQLKEKVSTNVQLKKTVPTTEQLKKKVASNAQLKVSPNTQLKEKLATNDQLKEKVATKDQLKEKIATNDQLKEKVATKNQLKEKIAPNIPLKEKVLTSVQLKEKASANVQLKEKVLTSDQLKKKVTPNIPLNEKASTNVQLKEKVLTSGQQKEKASANIQLKETVATTDQLKKEVENNAQLKEKVSPNAQVKEKIATNDQLKEKVATNDQLKKELATNDQLKKELATNVPLKNELGLTSVQQEKVSVKIQLKEKVLTNVQPKEKVSISVQHKEKVLTNVQLKDKVVTNVQPKEKVATNIQLKKVATKDKLKEKVTANVQIKEKVSPNIQLKEKVTSNVQPKEKVATKIQLKEKVATIDQLKKKVATKDQLKEKVETKDQLKKKVAVNIQLKEKISTNVQLKDKISTNVQLKKKAVAKSQLKEKKSSKNQLKERELTTCQLKEKESYKGKLPGKVLTKEKQLDEELSDLEEGEIID